MRTYTQVCGADISLEADDGLTVVQLATRDAAVDDSISDYLVNISQDADALAWSDVLMRNLAEAMYVCMYAAVDDSISDYLVNISRDAEALA